MGCWTRSSSSGRCASARRGKRSAAHSLGHDTSDKRLRYGIRGLHQINGGKTSNGTARSATVCGCRLPTMGPVSLMTTQRAARASGTWGRRPSAWAAGSSWRRAGPNGERRDLRAPLRAYERRELKCLQPRSESCWWVITRLCGSRWWDTQAMARRRWWSGRCGTDCRMTSDTDCFGDLQRVRTAAKQLRRQTLHKGCLEVAQTSVSTHAFRDEWLVAQ